MRLLLVDFFSKILYYIRNDPIASLAYFSRDCRSLDCTPIYFRSRIYGLQPATIDCWACSWYTQRNLKTGSKHHYFPDSNSYPWAFQSCHQPFIGLDARYFLSGTYIYWFSPTHSNNAYRLAYNNSALSHKQRESITHLWIHTLSFRLFSFLLPFYW